MRRAMTDRYDSDAPVSDAFTIGIDEAMPVSTPEKTISSEAPATAMAEGIEPLLEIADLQRIFHRSDRTFRRWIAAGHLTPIRVGGAMFFHPADVRALIAKRLRR